MNDQSFWRYTNDESVSGRRAHPLISTTFGGGALLACDLPMLRPPRYDRCRALTSERRLTARECRPARPRPRPRWRPERTSDRQASSFQAVSTLLHADALGGQIRINFKYNSSHSSVADFCDKPGRQQFCEGPHETAWLRWLTVNGHCTNFLFQPIWAIFTDAHGNEVESYWDLAIELLGTFLVFAEIKADRSFFQAGDVTLKTRLAVEALKGEQAVFAMLMGTDFDSITAATIKAVFDRRRTSVDDDRHVRPLLEAMSRSEGLTTLREAKAVVGGHDAEAEAVICAMVASRILSLDLDVPLHPETTVRTAPTPLGSGALDRFLARFAEELP